MSQPKLTVTGMVRRGEILRPLLIGVSCEIIAHPTWKGRITEIMPAGEFFATTDAICVLVTTPTTLPSEMTFKGHEIRVVLQ